MISSLIDRYNPLRAEKPQPKTDPRLNRTYLALFQAKRDHSFIEVAVDGDEVLYQSMILEVDPDERSILIDELFPQGFVGLPGQKVKVGIRQNGGRKLTFNSVIMEQHQHGEAPLYVLEMPLDVDSAQRRGAYRLPIGHRAVVESRFIGPDQHAYSARLRNLSSTGVSMEVVSEEGNNLRQNDQLHHLMFDFAGLNVDCGVTVRNIDLDESNDNKMVIGVEFMDLPPVERRVLERAITRVQRDRIRQSGDLESQLSYG